MSGTWLTLLGTIVSIVSLTIGVVFRLGRSDARLEALEDWRRSIRDDMHEISEQMQALGKAMTALTTIMEERTERRKVDRG